MSHFPHLDGGSTFVRFDTPWVKMEWVLVSPHFGGGRYVVFPAYEPPFGPNEDAPRTDAAPDPAQIFVQRPGDASQERERRYVLLHASRVLATALSSLTPDKLVAKVVERTRLAPRIVEGWIRLAVARNDLKVAASEKSGVLSITMSSQLRGAEAARAFASRFAHDLVVQAEDIGLLIHHAPTKGAYREELLRTLLQKHVPSRFHAATGFIFGQREQLDIVVYDQVDYAPLFRQGDLVVVPQEAVRAVIEVKSNLTAAELQSALGHLRDAVPGNHGGPPIFKGVFGFRGATYDTLAKTLSSFYGDFGEETSADNVFNLLDFHSPVHAVCVLQRSLAMVEFKESQVVEGRIVPVINAPTNSLGRAAEAALFFDRLSRFLRSPFAGGLKDVTRARLVMEEAEQGQAVELRSDAWGPYNVEEYDLSGVDDLKDSQARFENWLAGGVW
ncbi:DUF6602 domain-containing protein [Brevundimonas diminuta]|uniref:DUF6602 domain-containing protein n=1 Tax=Brevundimonas diminuta TaxID=293 RepID=UPI0035E00514